MGNSSSNNNLFIHCNIYPDPPDIRDKIIELSEYNKFIELGDKNLNNHEKKSTSEISNSNQNDNLDINQSKLDSKYDNCNNKDDLLLLEDNESINSKDNLNFKSNFRRLIDLRANIDVLPIYNLTIENIGMTAVNSIGAIIYSLIYSKGGSLFCPSRCFIMYNTLWKDHYFNELNESKIQLHKLCLRDYLKSLKRFGICDEKNYSFQYENLLRKPSELCYNEGKYLQFNYFRVPNDLNIIKYFLSNNHMILCNLSIYNSFLDNETKCSGRINFPQEMDSYLGMLACCIVGYNDNNQSFILRFPFGVFWGDKGYGLVNYDYALKLINDLWIITVDVPFIGNISDLINKNYKTVDNYINSHNNISINNSIPNPKNLNYPYHQNHFYSREVGNTSNIQNSRKYKIGGFSTV